MMASDGKDAREDEKPPHKVRVDGFWIDKTPVTNRQFREFVEATGYITTAEKVLTLEEIMSQVPPGTPPPTSGGFGCGFFAVDTSQKLPFHCTII